jgi:hypothetical protein
MTDEARAKRQKRHDERGGRDLDLDPKKDLWGRR